jgi:hypothetical protein
VLREQCEHVIKERNARFDLGPALAIKVEPDGNPGLFGMTFDF